VAADNRELLDFYRSQENRLRAQLKLLEKTMGAQAAIINAELAQGPEVKQALRTHGIPDWVVSGCRFSGSSKGVVVEFPRMTGEQKGRRRRKRPPFTKPTPEDKTAVFAKADEKIGKMEQAVLDNRTR
jgi:hypothetical protein